MFIVYVLHSSSFNKIYIGFSSNLEARIAAHNAEKGKGYTHRFKPWIVIHSEQFTAKAEALKREKQLKSAKGREFIWSLFNYEIIHAELSDRLIAEYACADEDD